MTTIRELQTPSGSGIRLHPPVSTPEETRVIAERGGRRVEMRRKFEDLRSRSLDKLHDLQHEMAHRKAAMKQSLRSAASAVRVRTKSGVERVQQSTRNKPMQWAGVATATGLGLGLAGRLLHRRRQPRRLLPDIVVIETRC